MPQVAVGGDRPAPRDLEDDLLERKLTWRSSNSFRCLFLPPPGSEPREDVRAQVEALLARQLRSPLRA
jgi:hypothetical protein